MSSSKPPKLRLTGDEDEPDPLLIRQFSSEGFDVTYVPYGQGGKVYREKLKNLADDLELGESYAIVCM